MQQQKFTYWLYQLLYFLGQIFDKERRLVVRRHLLGDPHLRPGAALRGAGGQEGGGQPERAARDRRPAQPTLAPLQLSARHLRPDERVLGQGGDGAAQLQGDPPLPAAQEPRLQPRAGPGQLVAGFQNPSQKTNKQTKKQNGVINPCVCVFKSCFSRQRNVAKTTVLPNGNHDSTF